MVEYLDCEGFRQRINRLGEKHQDLRGAMLPAEAGRAFSDEIQLLFGPGVFSDMVLASFDGSDAELADSGAEFLHAVIDVVNHQSVLDWLFRILWAAHESTMDAAERVQSGAFPLPGDDGLGELVAYTDSVCRMEAWILLTWSKDQRKTNAWAEKLLTGRYPEVLDAMLPDTSVEFDEHGFEEFMRDVEAARARREHMAGPCDEMDSSVDECEEVSRGEEKPLAEGLSRQKPAFIHLGRQYVFENEHVQAALRSPAASQSGMINPWLNADFVEEKLVDVMGCRLSASLRDEPGEMMRILDYFRDCVNEYGIPALPILMMAMIWDGGAEPVDADVVADMRHMGADCAGLVLHWIHETDLARDMALSVLRSDMEMYSRLADQCLIAAPDR